MKAKIVILTKVHQLHGNAHKHDFIWDRCVQFKVLENWSNHKVLWKKSLGVFLSIIATGGFVCLKVV